MKKNSDELYIIDGSSYLYRGYFAIRQNLTTSKGFPTKAIFNVTNMVMKVLKEKDPAYCVVVWDAKGPSFRNHLFPEYKANRPPMPEDLSVQIPHVKDIVAALGIPQLEVEGVEADDTIAAITRKIKGLRKVIVSGDKDLLQLVDDCCVIWDPMKDTWTGREEVLERFGLEPQSLVDVQALSGDSSDNIPGVKGIGPKKALKLIQDFGSLDQLINRMDELPKGKLKEELQRTKDRLPLFKLLVTLKDDVDVPTRLEDYRRGPLDRDRLKRLFEEFELRKFLNEIIEPKSIQYDQYELVTDREKLQALRSHLERMGELVIDTETTGLLPMEAELVGISISTSPPKAYYIPIGHKGFEGNMALEDVKEVLGSIFTDPSIRKIGQNIKFDLIVLRRAGMDLAGIYGDTMVASYLLDPSKRSHSLDTLSKEYLGHQMISYKELFRGKKGRDFSEIPVQEAMRYSCEDVHITHLLKGILFEKLKEVGLLELFEKVEMPLVKVLATMEENGVLLDIKGIEALGKEFDQRIERLKEEIFILAGGPFNINSHQQLQEILFDKLGLNPGKKTRKKTGHSTDIEVLTELKDVHPICGLLIQYRNLTKLKGTYIDGLLKVINPETSRVHTSFNQTVTATGRLSSSNPNLQNIPVRTEEGQRLRALFIAPPGHVLLSADYSQIDLRVLAHYSKDDALIRAFREGEDIHSKTASEIFDCHPAFVTPEMRRIAKTVNFGIIYGMSPYGLAKELGIERSKAKAFIDRYFKRYPGVKKYMDDAVRQAKRLGYVTTILGRRRFIPEIKSPVAHIRNFAERTAINTPIQGSAADIIKLAMIRVHQYLESNDVRSRLILQVHDELVMEVPEEELEQVKKEVKEIMEGAVELRVPLKVNVAVGKNWAEAK